MFAILTKCQGDFITNSLDSGVWHIHFRSGQPHRLIKTVNKTVKVFGICFSSTSFFFSSASLLTLSCYLIVSHVSYEVPNFYKTHTFIEDEFLSLVKSFGLFLCCTYSRLTYKSKLLLDYIISCARG